MKLAHAPNYAIQQWMTPLVAEARDLRKNATEAEVRLWGRLRRRAVLGWRFRRQHPIGPFVADFCCLEALLIVEVDGGQHAVGADKDAERTATLGRWGYRVVRFWNHEVMTDLDSVVRSIGHHLGETPASPPPPSSGSRPPRAASPVGGGDRSH